MLEQCLSRIDQLEEQIRAWVFVDRDGARAEAKRLTTELKRGHSRGPLHGIPIGVKDIIDVFDWPTAAGSKRWAASYARADAAVVAKLRHAGAIFVGKTVTTAYASFDPSVTRNPWNAAKTPGGSSSGSAAAVACGMCLAALGTQTGGSITRPASFCGVASIKPTYGRVPTTGVVPLAPSLDHVGGMANGVGDLALLFSSIAGPSGPLEMGFPGSEKPPSFVILQGLFQEMASSEIRSAVERVMSDGYGTRKADLPAAFSDVLASHRIVMAVEAAAYHQERLQRHPDDYPPRITELINEGHRTPAVEYRRALLLRDGLRKSSMPASAIASR